MTVRVIRPRRGPADVGLLEIWEHRELFQFLLWRDVKLRYRQTVLGVAWAVLQPLLAMLLFTAVFGRVVGVPSDGVPYALFVYAGMAPWAFFAAGMTQAAESLTRGAGLVTKVYFPRMLLPVAAATSQALDLGITVGLLLVLMLVYGLVPDASIVLLPLVLALLLVAVIGASLWSSALTVAYRDVRHAVPFLTQLWFWATPVVYPGSLIPAPWRIVMAVNPIAGVVEGLRAAVLGTPMPWSVVGVSTLSALILLVTGVAYFRRVEDGVADLV